MGALKDLVTDIECDCLSCNSQDGIRVGHDSYCDVLGELKRPTFAQIEAQMWNLIGSMSATNGAWSVDDGLNWTYGKWKVAYRDGRYTLYQRSSFFFGLFKYWAHYASSVALADVMWYVAHDDCYKWQQSAFDK